MQEIPRHTSLHLRGTPRVPPQLKKSSGFLSSSRDEGLFPCFVRKGIPAFPLHLKRRGSQLETQAELQGSCHNFKRSRCPTPLQRNLIPCSDSTVTLRIDTNMMAVVTALWHLKRSHRSLCQLDRNPDTSLTAREESGVPCLQMRRGLTPLLKLHRNPEIHVSTRGRLRFQPQLEMRP